MYVHIYEYGSVSSVCFNFTLAHQHCIYIYIYIYIYAPLHRIGFGQWIKNIRPIPGTNSQGWTYKINPWFLRSPRGEAPWGGGKSWIYFVFVLPFFVGWSFAFCPWYISSICWFIDKALLWGGRVIYKHHFRFWFLFRFRFRLRLCGGNKLLWGEKPSLRPKFCDTHR